MIPSLMFVLCLIQYQKSSKKDSQKEWKSVRLLRGGMDHLLPDGNNSLKIFPDFIKNGLPNVLKG